MASNIFNVPAGDLAAVAAELMGADIGGLGPMVTRHLDKEFTGGRGATIKIPVPGATPARTRGVGDVTTPIVTDSISEQVIPVTLSDHVTSAVVLSEADMSLNLKDYGKSVLKPQADALQRKSEASLAAAMVATPVDAGITYDAATPAKAFTAARKALRANGVPAEAKLRAVVGTDIFADLLDAPKGSGMDENGTHCRGIEVRESSRIPADSLIVFIPEAFALVMIAPVIPAGASYGASVKTENAAVRVLRDYDSNVAADRSLVSAFIEATALPLAVVDEDAGTVSLVPNGGAVHIKAPAAV